MRNDTLNSVIRWAVTLAIPFLLTLGTVRLLIAWDNPSYPEWEYGRIEPDVFGFTREERLAYAEATLAYLRRPEPAQDVIYLLQDLRLPNSDQPLYNEREIGHMLDVKVVADAFQNVLWFFLLLVAGGLILLLGWHESRGQASKAIRHGGLLTVILVIAIMVFMGAAWGLAFTVFHNLFFASGTWTFLYSDSLIRLFPEQFWFDFGLMWTGFILLEGIILSLIGFILGRRWE